MFEAPIFCFRFFGFCFLVKVLRNFKHQLKCLHRQSQYCYDHVHDLLMQVSVKTEDTRILALREY